MINNNKNSTNVSLWSNFDRIRKKLIRFIYKTSRKNKFVFERFQLTSIYFCAFVVLSYSIQAYTGGLPEICFQVVPYLEEVLDIPYLKILSAPEKTFFLYLVLIEVILTPSRWNFSLLIKYNVLLIFIFEMFQNLVVGYFDLFWNREIEYMVFGISEGAKDVTLSFLTLLYFFCLMTYLYCYIFG